MWENCFDNFDQKVENWKEFNLIAVLKKGTKFYWDFLPCFSLFHYFGLGCSSPPLRCSSASAFQPASPNPCFLRIRSWPSPLTGAMNQITNFSYKPFSFFYTILSRHYNHQDRPRECLWHGSQQEWALSFTFRFIKSIVFTQCHKSIKS